MYYYLPKDFAHDFSLKAFLSSAVGREYELLKLINIKVIQHSKCSHDLYCPAVVCQISHDPIIM